MGKCNAVYKWFNVILHDYPYYVCGSMMMSRYSNLLMVLIRKKRPKNPFALMFVFHTDKLSALKEFHSLLTYTKVTSQDVFKIFLQKK